MGGKVKQSQRTKNNVRPSNSGRSAELLSNAVGNVPLVGLAGDPLFPTLADTTSIDQCLNADFMLCIKKLHKKDPITKTKALQELTELVKNSSAEDVKSALPHWTRSYQVLSGDVNHKVRETAQMTHGTIACAAGRSLAPHLRQLLPTWLAAQFDSYAPAAAAASTSLHKTFPARKLPEVLSFCKAEVLTMICEILTGSSETSSKKKSEGEDAEAENARRERAVCAALRTLCFVCTTMPEQNDAWLWEQLLILLESTAFWKLATHPSLSLRAAWVCALGDVWARAGAVLPAPHGPRAERALLNAAGAIAAERSPLLARSLADCLLTLGAKHKDWHISIEKKDELCNNIFAVVENAAWGDGRAALTLAKALLAGALPMRRHPDLFRALLAGLEKKNVLASKSERQIWLSGIAECLRCVGTRDVELVISTHRAWLEAVLSPTHDGQVRTNLIKYSAAAMTALVKEWMRNSSGCLADDFDRLVRNYWHNIASTLVSHIQKLPTDEASIVSCIDGHVLLLNTLKSSFSQDSKKRTMITFADDKNVGDRNELGLDSLPLEDTAIATVLADRYERDLRNTVCVVCSQYFEFAETKAIAKSVFPPLLPLLSEFDSEELFASIAKLRSESGGAPWTLRDFYEHTVRRWLADDMMRCRSLAEVALLLLPHLDTADHCHVLESLARLPPVVVEWCVRAAASHPHRERAAVRPWLRGASTVSALTAACDRLVRLGDGSARDLLLVCLAHDAAGELLISSEAVEGVLKVFVRALADMDGPHLDCTASLASQLVSALAGGEAPVDALDSLLRAMFRLTLWRAPGAGALSADTWREVRAAWQDGLASVSLERRQATVDYGLDAVRLYTLSDDHELHTEQIERAAELCPGLSVGFNEGAEPRTALNELAPLVEKLMQPKDRAYADHVETFVLRLDCVTGRLSCPLADCEPARRLALAAADPRPAEIERRLLLMHAKHLTLRACYFRALITRDAIWGEALLTDVAVSTHYLQLLRDFRVLDSLYKCYGFWPHYDIIEATYSKVNEAMDEMMRGRSTEVKQKIYEALSERATAHGYYWALARKHFGTVHLAMTESDWISSCAALQPVDGSAFFHNLQAACEDSNDHWERYRARWAAAAGAWVAAHATRPALAERLARALPDLATASLDLFIDCYYADTDTMLYDRELWSAPWEEAACVAGVADALCELVACRAWDLPAHHWDFINIALCSLTNSLRLSGARWSATQSVVVARPVFQLLLHVDAFVSVVPFESERRLPASHVAALPTEWREMFAPDLHTNLLLLTLHVLESGAADEKEVTANHVVGVGALARAVRRLRWDMVGAARRAQDISLERLAAASGAALAAPAHSVYQYLAHNVLHFITEPLYIDDKEKLKIWTGNEDPEEIERPKFSLSYFEDVLRRVQRLTDAALEPIIVGEATYQPAPASADYRALLSHLLLCERLLSLAHLAHDEGELTEHYTEFFRGKTYIEKLLCVCLRLMPERLVTTTCSTSPTEHAHLFTGQALNFDCSAETLRPVAQRAAVEALACRCFYLGSGGCGAAAAAARGWWGAVPTRLYRLVQRLVTTYVTPPLARRQLAEVAARAAHLPDTEVVVHLSTREVECCYSVDERPVRLHLQLSDCHPLGAPRVEAEGAPEPHLHWLAVPLACQNGSVWRALRLWRVRLARRVENSPVCYVCYMRLHPESGRLPRQRCQQCRNKFHHECLQKWFSTSKKMECPLCRAVYKT